MPNTDYDALYPDLHTEWVLKGGKPQESFEMHLRGMGIIPSTKADMLDMIQRQQDHLNELARVIEASPFE